VKGVLKKLKTQDATRSNLQKLRAENEAKIGTLQTEVTNLSARVDDLKYSGTSVRTSARRIIDELEQKLIDATTECESNKRKYERLQRIVIDAQAGIEHLLSKIAHVEVSGLRDCGDGVDANIIDMLYNCETTLSELQRRTHEAGHDEKTNMKELTDATSTIKDADLAASRPFNRRINLNGETKDDAPPTYDEKVDNQEEIDENVQREQMKLASMERIMRHEEPEGTKESKPNRVEEQALRRKPKRGSARPGGRAMPA